MKTSHHRHFWTTRVDCSVCSTTVTSVRTKTSPCSNLQVAKQKQTVLQSRPEFLRIKNKKNKKGNYVIKGPKWFPFNHKPHKLCNTNNNMSSTEPLQKQQYGSSFLTTFTRCNFFLHIWIANVLCSKITFQRRLNLSASKDIKAKMIMIMIWNYEYHSHACVFKTAAC